MSLIQQPYNHGAAFTSSFFSNQDITGSFSGQINMGGALPFAGDFCNLISGRVNILEEGWYRIYAEFRSNIAIFTTLNTFAIFQFRIDAGANILAQLYWEANGSVVLASQNDFSLRSWLYGPDLVRAGSDGFTAFQVSLNGVAMFQSQKVYLNKNDIVRLQRVQTNIFANANRKFQIDGHLIISKVS